MYIYIKLQYENVQIKLKNVIENKILFLYQVTDENPYKS